MNLISPYSLLLFIPLGGIIVLLYLLKLKRKERTVSSTMLWRDALADVQANAPFQKLRKNLLLFLQLAILLMLVAALARPFMRVQGLSENRIILVLDASASMQSTDTAPSRFEHAKRKAAEMVDRMGPGDTMLVMTAGAKPRVAASFTSDKKSLGAAIAKLAPEDTQCDMARAVVLALSLSAGKSPTPPRIVVLSDGRFGRLADLALGNAKLDFIKIGSGCGNVAITGLSSRKALSGRQQVFVGLQNFSERERRFNLEIYLDDQLVDIREETLPAGASAQEIVENIEGLSGRVTAKLDIKDDLAIDNSGYAYLSGPRKTSVLLISKGNIFLQNALNLDPAVQLTKTDALPANYKGFDIIAFDGVRPPADLPPGGYLLIDTSTPGGPATEVEVVSLPTVVDFARDHPVSAHVDFSDVHIQQARYLTPRPWAKAILEGPAGALAAAGENRGRRFVQLSWSIMESDFPLHVGFPIFIANSLDWLAQPENAVGMSVRAGQPVYIDVPPATEKIRVIDPSGGEQVLPIDQSPVIFDGADRVGIYKIKGKNFSREFACNLSSSQESNTRPSDMVAVGGRKVSAGSRSVHTNREFYWPLVLAALLLLSFEWYAYHRRL
ncbi:MAG: vWA domain-containing protein [Armatimonadota bacterium]